MATNDPLIIVGGGLAGSLAAVAIAEQRPDLPLLLIEAGDCFGGNHVWSFFDGDIADAAQGLVASLQPVRWPRHEVRFPGRMRTLDFGYNSVHSERLDAVVRDRLAPAQWRLGTKVGALSPVGVTLADGTAVAASAVIDARGPDGPMPGLDLAWQKFVGVELDAPGHGLAAPIIMDSTVDQIDGYRFVYSLPFSADRLLVEDTYYSDGAAVDQSVLSGRIAAYAAARQWEGTPVRQETGTLPILLGGDPQAFWPTADPVARLGLKGGFFHPTTGYSLPLAATNAVALAQLANFGGEAIARWTRDRFIRHWRGGGFYRLLNRLLFRAAAADQRVNVFNHFYRLDETLIARFYAGRLTRFDKLRILSGRPPVPIVKALRVMMS